MKLVKTGLIVFFLLMGIITIVCAEDLNVLTDEFYLGLAQIIEDNMDSSAKCIKEVDEYYREQAALIEKIRNEAKKAFEKIAPMMEEYMTEDAPVQTGRKIEEAPMSEAMEAYSAALEKFTAKYPKQGLEISMKALQLLPPYDVEE